MFRQNNAILRERLCFFLSHFSVNMVGDKSERNKTVAIVKENKEVHNSVHLLVVG
jgi:hypothetical protein